MIMNWMPLKKTQGSNPRGSFSIDTEQAALGPQSVGL